MQLFTSRPTLRWAVPVAFLVAAAGTGLVAVNANADPVLPPRSAEQLLVDLQTAKVDGLSGSVVQEANLGIPAIPGSGGSDGSKLTSLISGTHNLKVWYASPDKSRLQVMGDLGETDVFTSGTDIWTWSSKDNTATHRTQPADSDRQGAKAPGDLPKTPEEAAQQVLKALDPSTSVTEDTIPQVAGRNAYDLVLTPKDSASTIGQVKIAIDEVVHTPLRVQVIASDGTKVFEVAYSSVDFSRPDDAQFQFTPPPGAKVTEAKTPVHRAPTAAEKKQAKQRAASAKDDMTTVGTGWTTVLVAKVPTDASGQGNDQLQAFVRNLHQVKGTGWTGRLLEGTAFSAVLTDDGRLAIGAVHPDKLYAALDK